MMCFRVSCGRVFLCDVGCVSQCIQVKCLHSSFLFILRMQN
uniref:Uncharacterized protein n=1 Tax=Anguilla anguilla TaxID=7936 RepID=A0A0E9RLG6_ANGAN